MNPTRNKRFYYCATINDGFEADNIYGKLKILAATHWNFLELVVSWNPISRPGLTDAVQEEMIWNESGYISFLTTERLRISSGRNENVFEFKK